eukprot:366449-Chlamydomonas_euryale.AAC.25
MQAPQPFRTYTFSTLCTSSLILQFYTAHTAHQALPTARAMPTASSGPPHLPSTHGAPGATHRSGYANYLLRTSTPPQHTRRTKARRLPSTPHEHERCTMSTTAASTTECLSSSALYTRPHLHTSPAHAPHHVQHRRCHHRAPAILSAIHTSTPPRLTSTNTAPCPPAPFQQQSACRPQRYPEPATAPRSMRHAAASAAEQSRGQESVWAGVRQVLGGCLVDVGWSSCVSVGGCQSGVGRVSGGCRAGIRRVLDGSDAGVFGPKRSVQLTPCAYVWGLL